MGFRMQNKDFFSFFRNTLLELKWRGMSSLILLRYKVAHNFCWVFYVYIGNTVMCKKCQDLFQMLNLRPSWAKIQMLVGAHPFGPTASIATSENSPKLVHPIVQDFLSIRCWATSSKPHNIEKGNICMYCREYTGCISVWTNHDIEVFMKTWSISANFTLIPLTTPHSPHSTPLAPFPCSLKSAMSTPPPPLTYLLVLAITGDPHKMWLEIATTSSTIHYTVIQFLRVIGSAPIFLTTHKIS